MSTTYTDFFTGKTVTPAFPQYSAIALTSNIELSWPNQFQNTNNVVSVTMDITPDAGGRTVKMPDAREVGTGFTFTINNPGLYDFNLLDNTGALITTIQTLKANLIWLRSNSTQAGTWRNIPAFGGAGAVSSVNATSDSDNLVITGVPITTAGTIALSLQQDLLALTQLGDGAVGFAARTATNTWALRSLGQTANQIIIGNPSGTAGNPTFSLAPNITGVTSLSLAGLTFGVGAANLIASSTNTNVAITPGGTGIIELNKDTKLATSKQLKFVADNGVNYVTFRAGGSAINQDFIWPTAAPIATQVLGFAGGSSLSWVSVPTTASTSTINALARFSNTVGGLKDSIGVTLSDARELATLSSCIIGSLLIGSITPGDETQKIRTNVTDANIILQPDGIGFTQVKGDLSIEPSAGSQRKLRLFNAAGTFFAGLRASLGAMVTDAIWDLPAVGGTAGYFVTSAANAMSIRPFPATVADIIPKFSDVTGSLTSSVLSISGAGVLTGLTSISSAGVFSISSTGATTISNTGALNLGGAANTTTNLGGNNASTVVIGGATNTGITATTGAIMTLSATTSASLATPTFTLSTATASSSITTGALVLAGGLGVGLNINATGGTFTNNISTKSAQFPTLGKAIQTVSGTALSNSTTETSWFTGATILGSRTYAANSTAAGFTLRFKGHVNIAMAAVATTLTLRLKNGAGTLASVVISTSGTPAWSLIFEAVVTFTGGTATRGFAYALLNNAPTTADLTTALWDSTISQTIDVTLQYSVANAGTTFTTVSSVLESIYLQ